MRIFQHLLTTAFLVMITLISFNTNAQNAANPWSLGIGTGKTTYSGDLGYSFFDFNQPYHGNVGLRAERYLTPSFDVALSGTYGRHGYTGDKESFLTDMMQGNLAIQYKLNNGVFLKENSVIAPYLSAGVGMANYQPVDERGVHTTDFTIPLAAGADVNITDNFGLFWQTTYGINLGDTYDGAYETTKKDDHFMFNEVGVKFNFGKGKDMDGDGVPDKFDACENIPGPKHTMGCPDTDNDGVIDLDDVCPFIAGPKKLQGCPDTDNDGIRDSEDACPQAKGSAAMNGCPDTDHDGLADNLDRCPTERGLIENKGCPVVVEEVVVPEKTHEVFERALRGVHFETGKANIKFESYPILDEIVVIMYENPSYILSIEGHTDAVGNADANMDLSTQRANAVKNYLTSNGIDAERMTAWGYGETQPISDNETEDGRYLNRRVAFNVTAQ